MGKKKNKKQQQTDAFDSGDDVAAANNDAASANNQPKPAGKKGKKKRKDDDWENDVFNELEAMKNPGSVTSAPANTEDNGSGEKKETPKSDAPAEGKADQDANESSQQTGNKKKKKKKGKKQNDNWEDDVQNEIANLNNPDENKQTEKVAAPLSKPANDSPPQASSPQPDGNSEKIEQEPSATTSKRDKKKKGKKKEEEKPKKETKKRPNKAMLGLMKEALQKKKEEEERLQREEEERIQKEEEAENKRLEELERERLKKEKRKQLKKDRIKRQKQEGTYKTAADKEREKRNAAWLEKLKEQGMHPDQLADAPKKPKYEKMKKNKGKKPTNDIKEVEEKLAKVEIKEPEVVEEEVEEYDDWEVKADVIVETQTITSQNDEEDDDEDDEEEEESDESAEEEEVVVVAKHKHPHHIKENPEDRIANRKAAAEAKRSVDKLRCPVIVVMGHVDTGKTKILDKLRHTNVQDGEAGGITQQIGATNVPTYTIRDQTKMVKSFDGDNMKVPGLLIIDTPGHESFSNLRNRGSSSCDMAILVVDIMHGIEAQTKESIKMLRKRKVPFVIALNKIDRLYQWSADPKSDVTTVIKNQKSHVQDEFRKRVNELVVEFAMLELNVKLFYENDDPEEYLSMIPTSAHSGDGMGDLMASVVSHCQNSLAKRLAFSDELQCTVLEVKDTQGLGTTIDVLLINGHLKYGDTIVLAGQEGPIVTHIKGLLMPEPLKEFRVKNAYTTHPKVSGAQGVRISAKELDKAVAGTSLSVAHHDDEVDILREEAQKELEAVLKLKVSDKGVFVQASTLGSLEALLEFLKSSKIPYAGINIGPVHKKDVVKASVMLERDEQWAVIMAFDVKIEREAQEHADHLGVRIFTADIIYNLFDSFMKHREDMKKMKQQELGNKVVFPCKISILPNCIFKTRDPIVVGVKVVAGQLRLGTPITVVARNRLSVGKVTSIQVNNSPLEKAATGQEVCIKIEGPPGDPPKMIGRHFEETDELVSEITRDSIDILKEWYRDQMSKADWKLVVELKKQFDIL